MVKSYWAILPVIVALSIVYRSEFWVLLAVVADFYTPWVLFESKAFDIYHQFLVSRLTVKPEIPLPELTAAEATHAAVYKASNGYTFPVVIRNLLGNTTAVQNWGKPEWWVQNYGDEELLCGTLNEVEGDDCTVRGFFRAMKAGRAYYVSGAAQIFERHPELHDMMDNEATRAIEPGFRTASQIFMGVPGTGSDIHTAIGVNVFRQIAGQKKWYFIPPHQTKYLKPSWNVNGFSAHTLTKIGKGGEEPSPWFNKLVRYSTVLSPGDVLLNPPWFWHGVENLGRPNSTDLVIGSPVRYSRGDCRLAAFRSNFAYSLNSYYMLWHKYGWPAFMPGFKPNLQKDIAANRKTRDVEMNDKFMEQRKKLVEETSGGSGEGTVLKEALHPFDEED